MWFVNKETNLEWHVTNVDLQERLSASAEYEVIEKDETEQPSVTKDVKVDKKKPE